MVKIDSILLPALATPFIMTYAIGPKETPYWFFGIIFLGFLLYLSVDLFNFKSELYTKIKQSLLWLIIIGVIGSASVSAIITRSQTAPVYGVHDIILQLEAAIRALLAGQNPYAITYFNTPLQNWNYSASEINPALYHFVMPPFYLLFSLLFYFVSISLWGFFDGRMPLVFLFFILLITTAKMVKDVDKRRLFLILLAFNPATLGYFLEGRDDIFMLAFLMGGLFLLQKQRLGLAGIPMALAFASKQSVWPIFPFYLSYLFFQTHKIKDVIKHLMPFTIIFALMVLPFFFWNMSAFLNSTIFYLSGNTTYSYPIAGYGWGSLLLQLGYIKDKFAYYPFWFWQIIFCGPLMIALLSWQKKSNTPQRLVISYGIFLFIFWYFSRYFNNSHMGFISSIFIIGWGLGDNEKN